MKRDVKSGRFNKTPEGIKTEKMLQVEKKLGRPLEEDYQEYYIEREWGQKKLSKRWNVGRNLVFPNNKGRRSWTEMLKLPMRKEVIKIKESTNQCEICHDPNAKTENAHWIPAAERGSTKSYNIIKLCPNCHERLDRGDDHAHTEKAKNVLFNRSMKKLFQKENLSEDEVKAAISISKQIIDRKL